MKNNLILLIAIIGLTFTAHAQTTGNECISDFTIELDGAPTTTNGVTTFQIIAKPKLPQATAIADAAGCSSQWVPLRFVGGANKQFCDNYFPRITSLTLPLNNGNFVSAAVPNMHVYKKGDWFSLNRVVKNCKCSCLDSQSHYNFRLDANNKLEVCKVQ